MLPVNRLLCLFLIGLEICVEAVLAKQDQATLATLCDNKPNPIGKISQAKKLIEEGSSNKGSCLKYRESFEALKGILDVVETGRICNMDLVDQIRVYHMEFIKTEDEKIANTRIPSALRYFFISLCFQINAECKMALVNNLEYDTKDKITESDYEAIRLLEDFGATLLDNGEKVTDFDDIFFMSDLKSASGLGDEPEDIRLVVKMRTNHLIRDLLKNCNNKFRPFYEKIILPLVGLSNLGYNYQGELLAHELEELKKNKLVHRWYHIVQTCEAFRSLVIVEDTSKAQDDRRALTFISKEEALSMREQHVPFLNDEIEETSKNDERIEYEPFSWHNGDDLWIKDQQELDSLVRRYKSAASETDRIRAKMMKKLMRKIKETIMSGEVFVFAKDILKCKFSEAEQCDARPSNVNQELLLMLDDAMSANSNEVELDRPVSGGPNGKNTGRRNGPIRTRAVPPRNNHIPMKQDGTKATTKLWNLSFAQILPSKTNMMFWFIGIFGSLLILISLMLMAG